MKHVESSHLSFKTYAFLLLFAAEFTYYLLILQTGIVTYHHSVLSQIWMVPAGGMLGIVLSVLVHNKRAWFLPLLLLVQLILSLDYADANALELFGLGLISGLTAPMLLFRIDRLWVAVAALALSYAFGTAMFHVEAINRTGIALFLTLLALGASFFAAMGETKRADKRNISLFTMAKIFVWLLLDAALFETLSRDAVMHLWGNETYTPILIVSHLVGVAVAYHLHDWKRTDAVLLLLFVMTYAAYSSGSSLVLSLVYPFVISYYNVIILDKFRKLHYLPLALMSLSLWGASGLGLLIALSHSFFIAWIVLLLLAGMVAAELGSPWRSLQTLRGISRLSFTFKGYSL